MRSRESDWSGIVKARVLTMDARILMSIDSIVKQSHEFGMLSMEFRILLYIFLKPGQPIKDVQAEVGLSHRGFYLKLQEFVERDFVFIVSDPVDKRRRCLYATESAKALIRRMLDVYYESAQDADRLDGPACSL
jgi:DNA-binding MarR family transcriptional regulator